jgi:hypothetical protein
MNFYTILQVINGIRKINVQLFCAEWHGSNNKLVIGCPGSSIWHGVVNLENCSDTLLATIETKYGMRNF